MIRSPLPAAILYLVIGVFFVYWAIQDVQAAKDWTIFSILLAVFAAFDFYTSFRYFSLYFKIKKMNNKK
ncbi:hypothetical protein CHH69_10455 [Terribacillus saccharophilus]|uniref:DUF4305 domain-containing protein n=1 Tax=Terribacillus saccharophilus TaxID=361277 RepID=UPI000BA71CBD|nr:DUF4305 domain-containing protein [Terribacillus saccharophilus]PAF36591.1 hypothetical protein CHH69_10455 [Terribacillus saccharophilus]